MKLFLKILFSVIVFFVFGFAIWFVCHWVKAGSEIQKSDVYKSMNETDTSDITLVHQRIIFQVQGWKNEDVWPCSILYRKNNASNYIARDISSSRSHFERAFISCRLEVDYEHMQLENYFLTHAYVGQGEYGVEMLAKHLFEKPLNEITLKEAVQIGLIIKSPRLRDNEVSLNEITQYWLDRLNT